jgi:hypothetical protein
MLCEMSQNHPAVERRHPPDALMRVANPVARWLIGRGRAGGQLLMLHYRGRRTGRRYDVPAGYHLIDGAPSVLTNSGWRHNFAGGADSELTIHGKRRPAHASLIDGPDQVAAVYDAMIGELGLRGAQRRLGIRINLDRPPTRTELRDAIQRCGLSIVRLQVAQP